MQDQSAGAVGLAPERRRQGRVLLGAIALALLGHLAFLGGLDAVPLGPGREATGVAVTVRVVEPAPAPAAEAPPEPVAPQAAPDPQPSPTPPRRKPRAAREPAAPAEALADTAGAIAAASSAPASAAESSPERAAASAPPAVPEPPVVAQAEAPPGGPVAPPAEAAGPSAAAASQPLLAAGQQPPPVYRTRFPAPATLRYQVRSGFLRGTGEIRWRREAEAYSVALEARIAGLTLLKWSSDGVLDGAGLAPTRFLDQRARRAPQAANFQRGAEPGAIGKITFSGPSTEWPLYAGTQDELSWMIQLAGIAAAEPGLLVDGGRITLVVVGARGEARVWNVRYAGRENVETAAGTVHAVKLLRDRDGPYDRSYEIWLDPEQGHLPAHVTRRNADGSADFDILLERIEPVP